MRGESRVLAAARAFAEREFPNVHFELREFGTPSLGPDNAETHFVVVDGQTVQTLLRVSLHPDGSAIVEPLSAS